MNKKLVIKRAEEFAQKILGGEGTGHDWWHIERVRANARLINRIEQADPFIVDLALLLHDVGDYKIINKPVNDYTIAEKFLNKQKLPVEIIGQVMLIVKNISFRGSVPNEKVKAHLEFAVAQDADRLDAVGAIGIARAFAYGGKLARPLYDPAMKHPSTLDHSKEKIFKLKGLMNTETGRKIASQRHAFSKNYYHQFLAEWIGRK